MPDARTQVLPGWLLVIISVVDAHLDAETGLEYRDQPLAGHWSRITKVCAEAGEVMDALSLATGENPRKGTAAGGWDRVLEELGDVMAAAAFGIQHVTKDPTVTEAYIIAAFRKAPRRVAEHQQKVLAGG
jgi:NTP pyrophosphatase (non-canonical NTP hydrolase)